MKNYFVPEYSIMDFEFYDRRRVQMHFHQNVEMFIVLEGKGTLILDDVEILLESGSYRVINVNRRHAFEAEGDVLYVCLHINFNLLSKYLDMNRALFMCDSHTLKQELDLAVKKVVKKIINCYFAKSGSGQVHLTTYYYQLLDILINHCVVYADDERFQNRKSVEQNRLNEIVNYVYANYRNDINLNDLAQQLYLSTTYLSKYIKNKMGMNFKDYVNNIRLYHVVEEIKGTEKKLTHIALDNGFPNITAFNKAFKRIYEITPSEFRENVKEKKEKQEEQIFADAKVVQKAKIYLDNQEEKSSLLKESEQEIHYVFANTHEQKIYNKYWNRMINVSYMSGMLLSDSQQHIIHLQHQLGFEYVRFWDIYADEMQLNIGQEDGQYNFGKMDRVFDFLHTSHIYPYIELGFKPYILVEKLDGYIVSQRREILFQSRESYRNFLNSFITHYVNRYGIEEVEKWKFEQWKDPRLIDHEDDFQRYFEVFETAYQTLKSVSPKIQIGGGSIHRTFDEKITDSFLKQWNKRMMHPDFITIYSYPYRTGKAGQAIDRRRSQNPDYLNEQIKIVKDILSRIGMHVKEIHVSEWNVTVSNRNGMNDSCNKGAYIMKNIIDNIGKADLLGYWLASDIFSQHSDLNRVLNGGVGLLSRDGIRKPSYFAFDFMNRLGRFIIEKTENVCVTSNGQDDYFIVLHNYKQPNYKYYTTPENQIDVTWLEQYFDDLNPKKINCQMKNVKNGIYRIKVERINEDRGSALNEWIRMGQFDNLTVSDIEYLRQISTANITMWECEVNNSVLNFETTLEPNEIQYMQVMYRF